MVRSLQPGDCHEKGTGAGWCYCREAPEDREVPGEMRIPEQGPSWPQELWEGDCRILEFLNDSRCVSSPAGGHSSMSSLLPTPN